MFDAKADTRAVLHMMGSNLPSILRGCELTDKELFEFVRRIKAVGGAITINVPIDVESGHIPEDTHSQLVRLSKAVFAE